MSQPPIDFEKYLKRIPTHSEPLRQESAMPVETSVFK